MTSTAIQINPDGSTETLEFDVEHLGEDRQLLSKALGGSFISYKLSARVRMAVSALSSFGDGFEVNPVATHIHYIDTGVAVDIRGPVVLTGQEDEFGFFVGFNPLETHLRLKVLANFAASAAAGTLQ